MDSELSDNSSHEEPEINPEPIDGWPKLAQTMATTPEFAAFPRFRDLNAKSLLYYQCQLTNLQSKLHTLEYQDLSDGKKWNRYGGRLVEMTESEQFKTIEEIRTVLKKYNKALLLHSQVCALPNPEPFNMRTLRKWLRHREGGKCSIFDSNGLVSTWGDLTADGDANADSLWKQFGRLVWGLVRTRTLPNNDSDLALTAPRVELDGLTHWIAVELIPFRRALMKRWKNRKSKGQDEEKNSVGKIEKIDKRRREAKKEATKKQETLVKWSKSGALKVTSTISTLVACLMPVVAISVLSQLHGLTNLLLCLAGFALLFALGIIFLTQGTSKRTEVFAATAAYVVSSSPLIIWLTNWCIGSLQSWSFSYRFLQRPSL
ncbi:hypothetical protein P280DRAFT_464076 [Massarina eburnea CBS 473.64]|uniref:DUF6594 domain-containing protein n=1 Tax=Massarina eburnea CBS 473.64 TaxID=1395130 RepID=A0A6A6RGJ5_9PLEO|nr:hypothetical protein P280DRAFT_464076 [Massarina eburnea CBS 473.64]